MRMVSGSEVASPVSAGRLPNQRPPFWRLLAPSSSTARTGESDRAVNSFFRSSPTDPSRRRRARAGRRARTRARQRRTRIFKQETSQKGVLRCVAAIAFFGRGADVITILRRGGNRHPPWRASAASAGTARPAASAVAPSEWWGAGTGAGARTGAPRCGGESASSFDANCLEIF